ncbi:MAG TPA: DNA polymerase/3'-5' exonuclease PolX [Phycisphaerae bacterium]|nr:DNA polymerase/3'-5' exonuclease PolX [Phycisphaerae bacterium]
MKNPEIADIFESIADLLEILDEQPFRVNSYRRAARAIGDLSEAIEDVAAAGRLQEIAGIGKSTAQKIQEYLDAGKVALHQELLSKVPPKLPELLDVPGLGPKTAAKLWNRAQITSIAELEHAIENEPERLTAVEGMGARKVRQIWESLAFLKSTGGRIRLGEAAAIVEALIESVRKSKGAKRVVAAGSYRRGRETVGDIDLLCQATKAAAPGIIERFAEAPDVRRVAAKGDTKGSVVLDRDVQADLRVVAAGSFGAALAYFTGSKEHNIRVRELAVKKGLKLNEYGLFQGDKQIAGAEEGEIYEALGLAYVPPELREDRGEVDAAVEHRIPELLELGDIRGDLHVHSTASDGLHTVAEMIDACRARGYQYVAFCDHSKSQIQANGLDEHRLAEHAAAIRKAAGKHKDILVLAGVEVDIFKDGSLDFEADVLAELDFVTASAHSALSTGRDETTRRLVRAIESPHVRCIGHPSGRIINSRPGMELDIEPVARAAAANDVALEINAHWMRLDLRDTHVRAALDAGAKILINTDAHSIADLDNMRYGVITARRGWATADHVVNTWSPRKLRAWLADR